MPSIALIGCGYWGTNLARNLDALHVLTHVCDTDKYKGTAFGERYRVPVFTDYKQVPLTEIDGAVIAVPPEYHFDTASYFLSHGKHVFVEKPMTMSETDAEILCSLADTANKILMVGHVFLYSNEIAYIKKYIYEGNLGSIYSITTRRLNLGLVQPSCNVVWDLAPHDIAICNYLLQSSGPIKIDGSIASFLGRKYEEEAFLSMTYRSPLTDKNVLCNMHFSWLAPKKVRDMVIVGSKAMLVYDMLSDNKVCIYDKSVSLDTVDSDAATNYGTHLLSYKYGDMLAPYIKVEEPLKKELEDFINCIKTGKRPLADGLSGKDVVAVLKRIDKLSGAV